MCLNFCLNNYQSNSECYPIMSYNKGHLIINVQQLMQKEADEEEWKKEKKEKTE